MRAGEGTATPANEESQVDMAKGKTLSDINKEVGSQRMMLQLLRGELSHLTKCYRKLIWLRERSSAISTKWLGRKEGILHEDVKI